MVASRPKRKLNRRSPVSSATGGDERVSEGSARERLQGRGEVDLERLVHELRTPLAAIQSTADALVGGHLGAVDPRLAAYLTSIGETARHALAVIAGMARLTDAGPGDQIAAAPRCDLGELAGEVVQGLDLLAERAGIKLEVGGGLRSVSASASPTDVRQMLINLVANGIAHAGRGKTVQVAVGTAPRRWVWLEVADDGPGVPRDVLATLEAGQSTRGPRRAGQALRMRLGLSLTRELAISNGGRLEIATGDRGTRARVFLPAGASQAASRPRVSPTSER